MLRCKGNKLCVLKRSKFDKMESSMEYEDLEEGTTFLWENLTVTVLPRQRTILQMFYQKFTRRSFKEPVTILNGVSGFAASGNLIAIMGPSGAGKTTFLAALSGKIEPTFGSIKINDQTVSRKTLSKISCYLPQFDALPVSLTVGEHILFTYALKTDSGKRERKFLSTKLLIDLGLIDCKDTLISKLSGGQRKRLSLASEMITKPHILFVDEPTTGLDTFSAMQVVESLRAISLTKTIIFCTIHQPGMAIYSLFSHVLFMSNGKIIYSGTLENATNFFSSQGYECPIGFDESEYYIKIVSDRDSETKHVDELYEAFLRSSSSKLSEITNSKQLEINLPRKAGCMTQFSWLTWRMWIQSRRTVLTDWISWLSYFLSMAAVVTFYAGINPYTQEGVQNTRGALYLMSSEISFTVAYSVTYEFPQQLLIYVRENGVYGCGPYYIATYLSLIPKGILKALIFTTVMYFIVTTETSLLNLLFFCISTTIASICSIAYGLMFSSWIDDIEIATSIMVPIDMLFLLTAGVFYNLRSLPTCLRWFKYVSIFFYLNEALSIIYWSKIDNIDCQASSDLPCLRNGKEVLIEYGFEGSIFWWDLCGLGILAIAMILLGYFGIRRKRRIAVLL